MLTVKKNSLSLRLDNSDHDFDFVWLRDNCQCEECLHPITRERTLITSEIPENITPIASHLVNEQLSIMWNDRQHQSNYSFEWLKKNTHQLQQYTGARFNDPAAANIQLWDNQLETNIPTFNYKDLCNDDSILLAWCEAIRDIGLAIMHNAPETEGEVERFAEHVAYVRETVYDRLHDVRAVPDAYNVALTNLELIPHTDMPNLNNPPGVKVTHFLVNEADGGVSSVVDGFKVANELKEIDPDAYQTLTEIAVPFRIYNNKGDIISANPILTLDTFGNLKVFRFSNQAAQPITLPQKKMTAFYHAYRLLGKLIEAPQNRVTFRLNSGDMMATNNLRVMNGRDSFNVDAGDRHLQLSYMDLDDVLSRIRMIKKTRG